MKVTLKPVSKRAKERINEHGAIFSFIKNGDEDSCLRNSILVESLEHTWRGQKWLGWFDVGTDVEVLDKQ